MIYKKNVCTVCNDTFAGKACPQGCVEGHDEPWAIKFGQKVWWVIRGIGTICEDKAAKLSRTGPSVVMESGASIRRIEIYTDIRAAKDSCIALLQSKMNVLLSDMRYCNEQLKTVIDIETNIICEDRYVWG